MQGIAFRAMGCNVSATVHAPHAIAKLGAAILLRRVRTWFTCWESRLSRFQSTSELCRLNCTHDQWQPVSDTLWKVLQSAMESARWTNGLVTPTVLNALEAAGYDRSFEQINQPSPRSFAPETPLLVQRATSQSDSEVPSFKRMQFDPHLQHVYLPHPLRLDLGGFAKGWAADQVAQRLGRLGAALVDVGGDIATRNGLNQLTWRIGIASPFSSYRQVATLPGDMAIATSGRDYRRWVRGKEAQHHIVNPHTGQSANTDVMTATVIAPSATQAEAAAKATLILGSDQGLRWLESQPALAGLLFLADGSRRISHNMNRYLCG